LAACGGGQETAEVTVEPIATTAPEEPTDEPEPTVEPTPAGPVAQSSFQDAIDATIQIVAEGSFRSPEFGMMLNQAGAGSGFIIDPSGIAVTNNHVVTGAAFLQVYVQGQDEPLNARVLGVSECSDLAVIDIEGDGYPFLEWNTTPVKLGTEVYALGYPLGDPEPSLTRGVISKEEAGGETSWASVDEVIEHDATINPGNSGGPLVTTDGKVVGVNYAGLSEANQSFAINAADARVIVEQLRGGTDLETIGINGEAVMTVDGDTGIWVNSVESGSPADRVGVEPGDIITKLEGLVLSVDGTMADYCDILRSRNATDAMDIEVLRYDSSEFLVGQLNGDELEQAFSFAQEVDIEEPTPAAGSDPGTGATYETFVDVYDDSNALFAQVPEEWTDVDTTNWTDDNGAVIGSRIFASPNLDDYLSTFSTPGIEIYASTGNWAGMTVDEVIDSITVFDSCEDQGRSDYSDAIYTGKFDFFANCGGIGTYAVVVAAQPADANHMVVIIGQAITDADLDALDQVLNTFNVVGALPG
jgi:serine protease Do